MQGPYPLKVKGLVEPLSMCVHSKTDAHISRQIAEHGEWESYETQLLLAHLFPGAVFVDVGANIGYYSIIASSLVGDRGRVFAFEPEQDNYTLLKNNVELNTLSNVTAVRGALSDHKGGGYIYLNEENRGDHQIYQQSGHSQARASQHIQLFNGAQFLTGCEPPVSRIDFLKVDTQGAEAVVMAGLLPLLKASLPDIKIILEFTPFSLRQAGSSGMALLDLVAGLDLPMQLIDHIGHSLIPISYEEMQQWILATLGIWHGNKGSTTSKIS